MDKLDLALDQLRRAVERKRIAQDTRQASPAEQSVPPRPQGWLAFFGFR